MIVKHESCSKDNLEKMDVLLTDPPIKRKRVFLLKLLKHFRRLRSQA